VKQGISRVTEIAQSIQQTIHTNVVTTTTQSSMNDPHKDPLVVSLLSQSTSTAGDVSGSNNNNTRDTTTSTSTNSTQYQPEEGLAATIADAFYQKQLAQQRLYAVQQFLDTFDLSAEDAQLLEQYNFEDLSTSNGLSSSTTTATGMAFLQALEHVRDIRQALTHSLGSGDSGSSSSTSNSYTDVSTTNGLGTSSALRMMEGLAQKQERAYERLYHWLQGQLQVFGKGRTLQDESSSILTPYNNDNEQEEDDDTMDHTLQHPFVQRALYVLRNVPAFYRHLIELMAHRRRQEETRKFLLALTVGYHGTPPMERLAHDAVTYTGDMLAFTFRAFSTQADVGHTLIHYQPEEENEQKQGEQTSSSGGADTMHPETENDYTTDDKPLSASAFVSICMSGMARPLKSRIIQVVASLARRPDETETESDDGMIDDFEEEGAVVRHKITQIYDICGLLLFYISAMEKTVTKLKVVDTQAGFTTEEDNNDTLMEQLIGCLKEAARAFEATTRVYCAMLTQLSSQTGDSETSLGHALVVMIAEVRLTSPGFAPDVTCPSAECETQLSMEWVTETVIEACMTCCKVLDDMVVLKQTMDTAQKAGMSSDTSKKLKELVEQTERRLIEALIEEETSKVLSVCGLGPIVNAWRLWKDTPDPGEMVVFPGLSPESMEASLKDFYASLFAPPLPSLDSTIKDPAMRRTARSKIASNVCDMYQSLYEDVQTSGGYDDLSFLGHTPTQVKTLFSV
jgi:hypothetical protein